MARKSRVITETEKKETAKVFEWKIGIYIRLSKEDLRNNDGSEKCDQPEENQSGICRGEVFGENTSYTTFMLMMGVRNNRRYPP